MTKLNVDPSLIETLAELLDRTGLSEIELAEGDSRVRVVRRETVVQAAAAEASKTPVAQAPAPTPAPTPTAADREREGVVASPMVGTVYLAPEPGAAPFVAVGATVQEGQTLLIVEAMKVMNPIRAPKAGTVVEIFTRNASPVEFGEPLLVIA